MTHIVEVGNPPFSVGDKTIVRFEVHPISFSKFAQCVQKANERSNGAEVAKYLQRERFLAQLKAIGADGQTIQMDEGQLTSVPIQYAKQFPKLAADDGSQPGKILTKGDGITSPILYQLGTPIKSGGEQEIKELEFFAKTYGDVEDVLMAENQVEKTMALIRMAKPVGAEIIALPSWAEAQVTMGDGGFIMQEILPGFIE